MPPTDRTPTDTLGTLRNVVASASRIAQDLSQDPLLPRLLTVFARMPAQDREAVLKIIEREVDHRLMSRDAHRGPLSGLNVAKPNPNARLYLRVTDSEPAPFVSAEEIAHAVVRAAQVIHRAFDRDPDLARVWEPAMIEGIRRMEAPERETLR